MSVPRSRSTDKFTDYYHLLTQIGVGGYGRVWTCVEKRTQQTRAVKIVPDKLYRRKSWSAEYGKQLPDEAVLWLPLSHPNMVSLLEVFYIPATKYWFLVMDYDEQYRTLGYVGVLKASVYSP